MSFIRVGELGRGSASTSSARTASSRDGASGTSGKRSLGTSTKPVAASYPARWITLPFGRSEGASITPSPLHMPRVATALTTTSVGVHGFHLLPRRSASPTRRRWPGVRRSVGIASGRTAEHPRGRAHQPRFQERGRRARAAHRVGRLLHPQEVTASSTTRARSTSMRMRVRSPSSLGGVPDGALEDAAGCSRSFAPHVIAPTRSASPTL